MSAVQISNSGLGGAGGWPNQVVGRFGPYQSSDGYLWVVTYGQIFRSTDGGVTWSGLNNSLGNVMDTVFDAANGIIYILVVALSAPSVYSLYIKSYTLATDSCVEVWSSGTRPTVLPDYNTKYTGFLTRRSTGEFVVFYQGPTHSNMGSAYRSVYYARCSAAGVWSSGVEVDAGGAIHFDCKSAVLGASDRVHMFYSDATNSNLVHRSLSSANALDTAGSAAAGYPANYYSAYYNATLAKIIVETSTTGTFFRATSGANPTWTADTGEPLTENASSSAAFIYEPTDALLYVFYRDSSSDDLYQTSTAGTAWGTPVVQDGSILFQSDHNTYNSQTYIYGGTGTQEQIAQTFQVPQNISVPSISLYIEKIMSPTDNVYIDICPDSSGSPGTAIATSDAVAASTLSGLKAFTFSSPPTLSANTTYWMVIRRSGSRDTTNYIRVWGADTNIYANGAAKYRSSGAWANGTVVYDLYFEIPKGVTVIGINVGLINDAVPIGRLVDGGGTPGIGQSTSFQKEAQSITFNLSCDLTGIICRLAKWGGTPPTDDVIIEIQTDSGNAPSGTVLNSITIPAANITQGGGGPNSFYPLPVSLTANTKYWIVFRRSGALSDSSYFSVDSIGTDVLSGSTKYYNGSVWSDAGADLSLIAFTTTTDIGVIFNDSGVYFDKLVLVPPEEPIEPTTTQEEFFALL